MSRFDYYRPTSPGSFTLFPPVIKSLLIINIAVFFLQNLLFNLINIGDTTLNSYLVEYFALNAGGEEPFYWIWQVFTYQFMHADFWHILMNMFVLWMFGMELERLWGSNKFLTYYLLSGVGAGITQLLVSYGITVGASGATFGLLIAFGLTFPNRQIFMFPLFIPIKAKYFVLGYAAIELFLGVSSSGSQIAHFAHLGGALTGFLLLKYGEDLGIYKASNKIYSAFGKSNNSGGGGSFYSGGDSNYGSSGGARVHKMYTKAEQTIHSSEPRKAPTQSLNVEGEEITQNKIDAILDKISASGYQSLTDREKKILFELSKKL